MRVYAHVFPAAYCLLPLYTITLRLKKPSLHTVEMTNLPLTTPNFLDPDFEFPFAGFLPPDDPLLGFQGNSNPPVQQWTNSTMNRERVDSALASSSSTVFSYPDNCTYRIDNTVSLPLHIYVLVYIANS